jgi:hypothetical protein
MPEVHFRKAPEPRENREGLYEGHGVCMLPHLASGPPSHDAIRGALIVDREGDASWRGLTRAHVTCIPKQAIHSGIQNLSARDYLP